MLSCNKLSILILLNSCFNVGKISTRQSCVFCVGTKWCSNFLVPCGAVTR